MLALFTAAIFLSALLLFLVQPMVGKMVLPVLGGTPAVWNTCMVFFQALLLAGYGYAHVLATRLGGRAQGALHSGAGALAALALPIALPAALSVPTGDYPIPWLLGVLGVMAGVPFLALSANGPLLQRWFSATDHPRAGNPYFLYAASNAGSLLALVGYPAVVEPLLTLREQSRTWSFGYALLVVMVIACAAVRARRGPAEPPPAGAPERPARRAGIAPRAHAWRERALWTALAFAPSSLMLGSTTFVSTDLAPVPLLWVIPLAVYLVTMIIAFSRLGPRATSLATSALPVAVVVVTATLLAEARRPISVLVFLHLAVLFLGAMACHGRLSIRKPEPARLTEYFLFVSIGGALGGLFNAVVAPVIFDRVLEYPIAIAGCVALALATRTAPERAAPPRWGLRPAPAWVAPIGIGSLLLAVALYLWVQVDRPPGVVSGATLGGATVCGAALVCLGALARVDAAWRRWALTGALPLGVGALFLCLNSAGVYLRAGASAGGGVLIAGLPALGAVLLVRRPISFSAAAAVLLGLASFNQGQAGTTVLAERSFFGVHRVVLTPSRAYYEFVHGSTQHGAQARDESRRRVPMMYFHPSGPAGDVFGLLNENGRLHSVGIVGLGAGALAAYSRPGQDFVFYEIDPSIVRVARDSGLFTYLSDAQGRVRCEVGDGRLLLAQAKDLTHDLIVIDAFNSDSIPAHLLTVEAMRLYFDRLGAHGVLLVHATNRHLALPLVLVGDADAAGLAVRGKAGGATPEEIRDGKLPSTWIAIARTPADLEFLDGAAGWITLFAIPGKTKVWTDDFSNILGVMERPWND